MSEIERALATAMVQPPSKSDGKIAASYLLPADFPSFQGHFPGNPICPAVVQSRAVLFTLEQAERTRYRLEEVSNAKFMSPLGPDCLFTVELTERPGGKGFKANVESEGQLVARLSFKAVPAGEDQGDG